MSFFKKRAGKFIGNVVRELTDKAAPQQHQEQHQEQLHNTQHPQPQRNHGDSFQQPFAAPPLNDHFVEVQPPQKPTNTFTADGTLEALKLPDEHHNTIPDFSRVGYREGHVRIPVVPVSVIVEPSNNDTVDDTARIQSAIDQVSAQPLEPIGEDGAAVRGAVLLKAGIYRVAGALIIHTSGVVLRGEGQDESGTIVVATSAIQRDFILVNGMLNSDMGTVEKQQALAKTKEMMPTNGYKSSKKPTTTTMTGVYVPVGETHIPVESIEGFSVGERIVIERPGSDEWINDIGMDNLPPRPDSAASVQWKKETFTFKFERTILGIDDVTSALIIDIPMVMSLDPKYPPAKVYELIYRSPMISDVGVENMRLLSECDPVNSEDESHGWYAVVMDNTLHGWVADVTTMHFVSGIFASTWSRYVTIQDCSVLYPVSKPTEGGRRYQFCLNGQMGLVKRCFTNNARHDFITLARCCGVDANNDTGPHERWAMGTLYDNITCNTINIRQRLWKGSGQGWSGAYQVVYSCTAHSQKSCFQDAPGATNWIIGFKGGQTKQPEFEAQSTQMMAANATVEPRSLYWAQLVARVGDAQLVENRVGETGRKSYPPTL
ncbi:hypothetical protein BGZ97_003203 [Linnemannia gamsii]|uniref:Pectate lyase superfamily protein domain-containing protein n=1 Tax=Linnemannia gamsii TaxID=64522 RepID=A0A9P6QXI0_9FUNG|nr:hypothetical protein BGZ97_003203 [Linnemannia gamsii]